MFDLKFSLKIDYLSENHNQGDSGFFSVSPKIHPKYEFGIFSNFPLFSFHNGNDIKGEFWDLQRIRNHPNHDVRDFFLKRSLTQKFNNHGIQP